jgi:hypothetical protein
MITRRAVVGGLGSLPFAVGFPAEAAVSITSARARALAKEAYIYGFPIVDGYRVMYAYYVDKTNKEYKGTPDYPGISSIPPQRLVMSGSSVIGRPSCRATRCSSRRG